MLKDLQDLSSLHQSVQEQQDKRSKKINLQVDASEEIRRAQRVLWVAVAAVGLREVDLPRLFLLRFKNEVQVHGFILQQADASGLGLVARH